MLEALENNPLAMRAAEALAGLEVYFVGGIVRDALLGRPCLDIDLLLVPGTRDPRRELRNATARLEKAFGKRAKRSQFMTGKILLDQGEIDIALARVEEYPEPGSLPVVRPATSIGEDLRRRDFTANAVAMTMKGQLVDPLGGIRDIRDRLLRVIYKGSFRDDPTRALRAIRYRHQLGFSYSRETEEEFALARKHLAAVSFERIKHELARSSERPERPGIWLEMVEKGLVGDKMPDLRTLERLSERAGLSPESWVMFYGLVSEKMPPGITRAERNILSCIKRSASRRFRNLGEAHEALRNAPDDALLAMGVLNPVVEDYLRKRPIARPLTGTEEMKAMGFSGENLGKALLALEKARIEARVKTADEETEFLRLLLGERSENCP